MYGYRKKNIIMVVMMAAVLFMAVGYALLSTTLNISGTSDLTGSWGVRIANVTYQATGKAYNISDPSFTDTTVKFNVGVKAPGDKMTFSVTVQNFGNIDALLTNISALEKGAELIIYSIEGINNQEILKVGETKTFTVSTYFDINATELPTENIKDLTVKLDYVQYDNQTLNTTPPVIENALTTLSGNNRLVLNNAEPSNLVNYKITGNSVQNGTPTPDVPVEIQSVGDKTKNLISVNSYELTGVTLNKVIFEGNLSLPAILSWDIDYIPNNSAALFEFVVDGTTKYVRAKDLVYKITGTTLTRIKIVNWPSDVGNVTNIQLEAGSVATDYEPYGYKIPVKVSGKNLLEINRNMPYTQYGLTVSRKSDGAINVKGDVTTIASLYLSSGLNLTLPAGTYTLNNTGIKGIDVYLLPGYTKGTFTLKTPKTYTGVYIDVTSSIIGQNIDFDYYPQLELGSVATDYEPYIEPITTNIYLNEPLRKVGNYYDYIDFASGKVVRNLKEVELDGTGAWMLYPNTTTGYTFYKSFTDSIMEYQSSLSSHFANVNGAWGNKLNGIYSDHYSATIKYFKAPNSDITTVDQFKNWLSSEKTKGTPVKLIYTLAKPIEENITLPQINIPQGNVTISIDSNGLTIPIEVSYYKTL